MPDTERTDFWESKADAQACYTSEWIAMVTQKYGTPPDFLYAEVPCRWAFADLDIPVLYMTGKDSPASSPSVARLLTAVLPRVEVIELEGLGHMAPLTRPHVVNAAITEFLARG